MSIKIYNLSRLGPGATLKAPGTDMKDEDRVNLGVEAERLIANNLLSAVDVSDATLQDAVSVLASLGISIPAGSYVVETTEAYGDSLKVDGKTYVLGYKDASGKLHIIVTGKFFREVLSKNAAMLAETIDHEYFENILTKDDGTGYTHREAASRANLFKGLSAGKSISPFHEWYLNQLSAAGDIDALKAFALEARPRVTGDIKDYEDAFVAKANELAKLLTEQAAQAPPFVLASVLRALRDRVRYGKVEGDRKTAREAAEKALKNLQSTTSLKLTGDEFIRLARALIKDETLAKELSYLLTTTGISSIDPNDGQALKDALLNACKKDSRLYRAIDGISAAGVVPFIKELQVLTKRLAGSETPDLVNGNLPLADDAVSMFRRLHEHYLQTVRILRSRKEAADHTEAGAAEIEALNRYAMALEGVFAALALQISEAGFDLKKYMRAGRSKVSMRERAKYGTLIVGAAEASKKQDEYRKIEKEAMALGDRTILEMDSMLSGIVSRFGDRKDSILQAINEARKKNGQSSLADLSDCKQLRREDLYIDGKPGGDDRLNELGKALNQAIRDNIRALQDLAKREKGKKGGIYDKQNREHDNFIVRASAMFLFALLMEAGFAPKEQEMRLFAAGELTVGNILEFPTGEGKTSATALALCIRALNPEGEAVFSIEMSDILAERNSGTGRDGMGHVYRRFLGSDFAGEGAQPIRHINTSKSEDELEIAFNRPGITYVSMANLAFLMQSEEEKKKKIFGEHLGSDGEINLYYGNVDELDEVLLDQFLTDYIIAEFAPELKGHDLDMHVRLSRLATAIQNGLKIDMLQVAKPKLVSVDREDEKGELAVLTVDSAHHHIALTDFGNSLINQLFARIGSSFTEKGEPLTLEQFRNHITKALIVQFAYIEGRDYVVVDEVSAREGLEAAEREGVEVTEEMAGGKVVRKVKLRDASGGVNDRRLSDLCVYLDAKHAERGTKVSGRSKTKSKLGGINVVESFLTLSGFTGTLPKEQVKDEMRLVFKKGYGQILQLPRRNVRTVVNGTPIVAATFSGLCDKLVDEIKRLRALPDQPPIVIIFTDGVEAEKAYSIIRQRCDIPESNLHTVMVNDDVKNAETFSGQSGHVTVGTPLIGRGINMSLAKIDAALGMLRGLADGDGSILGKIDEIARIVEELKYNDRERDALGEDSFSRMLKIEQLKNALNGLASVIKVDVDAVLQARRAAEEAASVAERELRDEFEKAGIVRSAGDDLDQFMSAMISRIVGERLKDKTRSAEDILNSQWGGVTDIELSRLIPGFATMAGNVQDAIRAGIRAVVSSRVELELMVGGVQGDLRAGQT
ncbi:MAG TPA: hypothetical protein PLV52_02075, partial [Candidatus Omnitrophota bacterium]|nr:hypothetical protein [Candidatus Omnitrophota bacterium]